MSRENSRKATASDTRSIHIFSQGDVKKRRAKRGGSVLNHQVSIEGRIVIELKDQIHAFKLMLSAQHEGGADGGKLIGAPRILGPCAIPFKEEGSLPALE